MSKFKSNGKKILSLLLAAGMVLSLAGCSKGGTPTQSGANSSADNTQQAGGQQQVQAEGNYYEGEYEKLPEDSSNIGMVTVTEKAIYYVKYVEEEDYAAKFMKYDTESKQVTEVSISFPDGYSIDQLCADNEGNLVAVSTNWESSGANGNMPYNLTIFKDDGSVIMEKDITELLADEQAPYIYHLAAGDDGRIYVAGGQTVWVLDKEGNKEFSVPVESWISEMGILPGGKLAVSLYEGNGMAVKVLDCEKKAWGDTYKNDRFGDDLHFTQAGETGIYFYDADALYSFDPESNEAKVLANWINNDILAEYLVYVSVQDESTIRLITCDYNAAAGGNEIALLKQADAKAVSDKQIITFGTAGVTTGIRSSVINFNKKSDKYRLQIIDYSSGTTPEEGETRFKNEITAGNMPDIINISDGTEEFYAAKGLLEDLKPYFDGELGVNRADYFENILTAMETGGKMYVLSPDFYIDTLVGKTKYVGEGYSWTMEDMKQLEETREEGVEMFDHETKAGVLDIYLRYNLAQFFDMNTGLCDFDNPEFRDILEFANRFPKENEYQEGDASEWRKASEGNLLLMRDGVMMIQDYQMLHNIFGEDISFVGYPSKFSCGSVAKGGDLTVAMSVKSTNKEGAWEFIRSLLEEDYQNNYVSYFPLLRSAFDNKAAEASKAYYATDENGNQVEQATLMVGNNDFTLEVFSAKEEEIAQVKELIGRIDRMERVDDQVLSIVAEEAGAYFDGQKSVEDVVGVIQSRANIYMNENK